MSGRSGTLVFINISGGGVPKKPVTSARVGGLGLDGDAHCSEDHGGPDRAICLYSLELITALRNEGHPIDVGTAGENFTVEGIDWSLVSPGIRFSVGVNVELETTSFTSPCKTIRESFSENRFSRISQKVSPGWSRIYARVLSGGEVRLGDPVILV